MSSQIPGITATGNSQATAQPIASVGQIFTADVQVVPLGTGVILPQFVQAPAHGTIRNSGSNTLLIYPLVGGTINGSSGAYGLTPGNVISVDAFSPIDWLVDPTGGGGGGGGTVTTISVVSANGVAGTVANPTTTPAITLTTPLTGVIKGNGTSFVVATAGTDYQAPITGSAFQPVGIGSDGATVQGFSTPIVPTVTATYGSTTTFNMALSNNQQVILAGNPTLALTNVQPGQRFTLEFYQDGTGSRTIGTWFPGITWAGGSAPTFQTAPGAFDTIAFRCVSTGIYEGYPAAAAGGGGGTPGGSSGQIQVNVSGSFAGATGAVIDSNSCFNLGGSIADPGTPVAGALWRSTASNSIKVASVSGYGAITRSIFSCESCTAVANTASGTSLFGSPANAQGSLTIAANALKPGNMLRWQLWGSWGTTGTSPTLGFGVYLNGTLILDIFGVPFTPTIAQAGKPFYTQFGFLRILTIGASGTAGGNANFIMSNPTGSTGAVQCLPGGSSANLSTTFASNASALFDIKATWSVASASNAVQVLGFNLELVQ